MSPDAARRVSLLLLAAFAAYCGLVFLVLLIIWETPYGIAKLDHSQHRPFLMAMVGHAAACAAACSLYGWIRSRALVTPKVPRRSAAALVLAGFVSLDSLAGIVAPPFSAPHGDFLPHPVRGWCNRPNHAYGPRWAAVTTDARGMRVDEVQPTTEIGDRASILFVGDSLTWGWGVQYREAFPEQTAEVLNRRHLDIAVSALNGGTAGYDTRQELDWLVTEGLVLKPRLVVLQFCLNDLFLPFDPERLWFDRPDANLLRPGPPLNWSGIGRAFWLWRRLPSRKTGLNEEGARVEWFGVSECLKPQETQRVRAAWQGVLSALDRFQRSCDATGVPMALVCFPVQPQIEDAGASTRPQERLAEWAAAHRVPYLDLLPRYRKQGPHAPTPAMVDLVHPSVLGHRIAAEALADLIERSGLLASLRGTSSRPAY